MATPQYIFVMKSLRKVLPGGRELIKDAYLSFYPGAKIGVVGLNGSGKSTLLRIMAGEDRQFDGEAWAAKGSTVGYLAQEPQLDPNKTVGENVMAALAEPYALIERFNALSARFGEELSDAEMDQLIAEQGALQEQIDAAEAWDLDTKVEMAMEALRCRRRSFRLSTCRAVSAAALRLPACSGAARSAAA